MAYRRSCWSWSGGPAITLAATNTGLAWSGEDVILFSADRGALSRVPASGGTPSQVTMLDAAIGETGHWNPFFLPDNRHFLYAAIGSSAGADQMSIELSPDGTRVLASLLDQARRARDLWIYDIRREVRSRFTFDAADEMTAAWSPDGTRVVFNSRRRSRFDLFQKAASGAGDEELVLADDQDKYPVSRLDGVVAYENTAGSGVRAGSNVWTLPTTGDRKPAVFLGTEFEERSPRVSPDGRWLAYLSNESGQGFEVYVTSFPGRSGKWQVSTAGGSHPRWRRDGKELFYLSRDNALMVAPVSGEGAALQVSAVRPLFKIQPRLIPFGGFIGYPYDASADGQRLLVNTLLEESEEPSSEPITLLVNWTVGLKK